MHVIIHSPPGGAGMCCPKITALYLKPCSFGSQLLLVLLSSRRTPRIRKVVSVVSTLLGLHALSFKEHNPVAACRCGKSSMGSIHWCPKPLLVLCPSGPQSILGHSVNLNPLAAVNQQSKTEVYWTSLASVSSWWWSSSATTVPVVDPGEMDHWLDVQPNSGWWSFHISIGTLYQPFETDFVHGVQAYPKGSRAAASSRNGITFKPDLYFCVSST